MAADEAPVNFAAEVQQAGVAAECRAHRDDMLGRFGPQSTNCSEWHANRADHAVAFLLCRHKRRAGVFDRKTLDAEVDARWQQQHAESAGLFRGGPKTVLNRAAVVQHLRKEAGRCGGIHLQTRLPEYVLCHGQRMPVKVQVTDVLKQKTKERIALADVSSSDVRRPRG